MLQNGSTMGKIKSTKWIAIFLLKWRSCRRFYFLLMFLYKSHMNNILLTFSLRCIDLFTEIPSSMYLSRTRYRCFANHRFKKYIHFGTCFVQLKNSDLLKRLCVQLMKADYLIDLLLYFVMVLLCLLCVFCVLIFIDKIIKSS